MPVPIRNNKQRTNNIKTMSLRGLYYYSENVCLCIHNNNMRLRASLTLTVACRLYP